MKATAPLLLISLLLTGPAHAAVNAESCKADAQKYCPDIKPGGGAIEACLKKHEKSLTPACTQYRQEAKKKVTDFSRACAGDINKSCAGVKPGDGRILACLEKNETTLSAECKGQIKPSPK